MTILQRMRIRRLVALLRRSDQGKLYARLPAGLAGLMRRRFIRQFTQYRSQVLAVANGTPIEQVIPDRAAEVRHAEGRALEAPRKVASARSR